MNKWHNAEAEKPPIFHRVLFGWGDNADWAEVGVWTGEFWSHSHGYRERILPYGGAVVSRWMWLPPVSDTDSVHISELEKQLVNDALFRERNTRLIEEAIKGDDMIRTTD